MNNLEKRYLNSRLDNYRRTLSYRYLQEFDKKPETTVLQTKRFLSLGKFYEYTKQFKKYFLGLKNENINKIIYYDPKPETALEDYISLVSTFLDLINDDQLSNRLIYRIVKKLYFISGINIFKEEKIRNMRKLIETEKFKKRFEP